MDGERQTRVSLRSVGAMDERAAMSLIDTRHYQMFPVLSAPQIETARRFASARRDGSRLANSCSMWASVRRPLGWFSKERSR
jgi:hypothetical protein